MVESCLPRAGQRLCSALCHVFCCSEDTKHLGTPKCQIPNGCARSFPMNRIQTFFFFFSPGKTCLCRSVAAIASKWNTSPLQYGQITFSKTPIQTHMHIIKGEHVNTQIPPFSDSSTTFLSGTYMGRDGHHEVWGGGELFCWARLGRFSLALYSVLLLADF